MAITVGTPKTGEISGGGPTSFTITAVDCTGSDRVLDVGVVMPVVARSVSSVVFNTSESASLLYAREVGSGATERRLEVWRLVAPSSTSADVVVTMDATVLCCGVAVPLTGVAQVTTDDGENFTQDATTTMQITAGVTHGGGDDLILMWGGWRNTNFTITPDAGMTTVQQHQSAATSSSHVGLLVSKDTDSSTPKVQGEFNLTTRWTAIAYNLNAAGAASTAIPVFMNQYRQRQA